MRCFQTSQESGINLAKDLNFSIITPNDNSVDWIDRSLSYSNQRVNKSKLKLIFNKKEKETE